ncbi:MAG TPA: SH3 domain-containing protein [Bacteroidetes bacterium]|nr:SH3 domain-containing protein [Bacteroidota bacterium]
MKNITFFLQISTLVFFISSASGQTLNCDCTHVAIRKVTARSGLSLRSAPSLDSTKLTIIPFGAKVQVGYGFDSELDRVEGISGTWVIARYEGKEGYLFDGFLEKTSAYSIFLDVEMNMPLYVEAPLSGLFAADELHSGYQQFDLRELAIDTVVWDDGVDSYTYPEVKLEGEKYPSYFFTGIPTDKPVLEGHYFTYDKSALYPGSIRSFYFNNDKYTIFATGNVVETETSPGNDWHKTTIHNYQLILEKRSPDAVERQVIYKNDSIEVADWGAMGIVNLRFAGDLDQDGKPDLVLENSFGKGYYVLLLLSSEAEKGYLVKLVYLKGMSCC